MGGGRGLHRDQPQPQLPAAQPAVRTARHRSTSGARATSTGRGSSSATSPSGSARRSSPRSGGSPTTARSRSVRKEPRPTRCGPSGARSPARAPTSARSSPTSSRVNLKPGTGYREGAAYPVRSRPGWPSGPRGEDTGWLGTPIDHLAAAYVTFVPADNAPPGRRLHVRIDGPPRGFSPAARVVVRFDSGRSKVVSVRLSKKGNGQVRVAFGAASVSQRRRRHDQRQHPLRGLLEAVDVVLLPRRPQGRRPPLQGSRPRPLTTDRPPRSRDRRGTAAAVTASYWSRPRRARLRRCHEVGQRGRLPVDRP